jgi:hypothetical protein
MKDLDPAHPMDTIVRICDSVSSCRPNATVALIMIYNHFDCAEPKYSNDVHFCWLIDFLMKNGKTS